MPDRDKAIWKGLGEITIQEAMGLDRCCCCNPEHQVDESYAIEFGNNVTKEQVADISRVIQHGKFGKDKGEKSVVPQEKKIQVKSSPNHSLVDNRRKLSAEDKHYIKTCGKSVKQLHEEFPYVTKDLLRKVIRGDA